MRKKITAIMLVILSLAVITSLNAKVYATSSTIVSTELLTFTGMSTSEINTFINICKNQGFSEITLRLGAGFDWNKETPSSYEISKGKQIISVAKSAGIAINFDLHTWISTWDNYFDDNARNYATNRAKYLNYVRAAIKAFDGYSVKAWMVLNEPQYQRASASENAFILDVINTAKAATDSPVSVRFMGGASPTTGHYARSLDDACDFICRNSYWDPRSPRTTVWGMTESKMEAVIAYAQSAGKEFWITEFGKHNTNKAEQAAYVAAIVKYANENGINRVFCWASQPENSGGEKYNLFDGYTPLPAFYELKSAAGSQNLVSSGSSSSSTDSSQSSSDTQTSSGSSDSGDNSGTTSSYSSSTSYSRYSSYRTSRYSSYSSRTSRYSRYRR